jgi:hypothetical protein
MIFISDENPPDPAHSGAAPVADAPKASTKHQGEKEIRAPCDNQVVLLV